LHLPAEARPKKEARLSIERTLRAHHQFWNFGSVDIMGAESIPLQSAILNAAESAPVQREPPMENTAGLGQLRKKGERGRKGPDRAVTGVSVATRHVAESTFKGDMRKLRRKGDELRALIERIAGIKLSVERGSKTSKKECALLGEEEEIRWQLEEVTSELEELSSLSEADVIRMYSGCK